MVWTVDGLNHRASGRRRADGGGPSSAPIPCFRMIPDAPVPGTMGDMQDEGIKDRVPGVGALEDDAADHDAG
jgi:hypothetical protein